MSDNLSQHTPAEAAESAEAFARIVRRAAGTRQRAAAAAAARKAAAKKLELAARDAAPISIPRRTLRLPPWLASCIDMTYGLFRVYFPPRRK